MNENSKNSSPWNSLELAKLAASILTPLAIVWFGSVLTEQNRSIEAERETQIAIQAEQNLKESKVIDQRSELWKYIAPALNDIYVYFLYVGHWKELGERDIIEKKRALDKIMWGNRPFFSDDFFNAYQEMIKSAFKPYGGWEEDARLRTRNIRPLDNSASDDRFTGEDNGRAIHDAYFDLLDVVAQELELEFQRGESPETPESAADLKSNPG